MAIFSQFFGAFMKHIIRWNAGWIIKLFFEVFTYFCLYFGAIVYISAAAAFLSHSFLTKRAQTTDYSWRGPLWRVGWQEPRPYLAQLPTMDAVKLHIWPKKGVRVHLGGSQKSNVSRKDVIIFRSADWLLNSLSCNSGLKAVSKVETLVQLTLAMHTG